MVVVVAVAAAAVVVAVADVSVHGRRLVVVVGIKAEPDRRPAVGRLVVQSSPLKLFASHRLMCVCVWKTRKGQ